MKKKIALVVIFAFGLGSGIATGYAGSKEDADQSKSFILLAKSEKKELKEKIEKLEGKIEHLKKEDKKLRQEIEENEKELKELKEHLKKKS